MDGKNKGLKSEIENAFFLFDNENYDDSLELIKKYANIGDKGAQLRFGIAYQFGLGIDRDIFQAKDFFERSAEQGCGSAAHNLGTLYFEQELLDPIKSKYWYKKAKDLGFVVAPDEWYEAD